LGIKADSGPSANLNSIITEIELLPIPVVASIERYALGGGLEVALGAHYRVITDKTQLGLPEINLGLLPGAGGTQRLPRVVGVENAIKAMIGGTPFSAKQALQVKLVDKVVPSAAIFKESVAFLVDVVGEIKPRTTKCHYILLKMEFCT
jgi:3-hydroxyacyl-CoA dehydrogenase